MRPISIVVAVVALGLGVNASARDDKKPAVAGSQPKVVHEEIEGASRSRGEKAVKVTGKVKVLDAHTLRFEDGTEAELNWGMDAPDLGQKGLIDGKFYPAGKEAAEFLTKLIGDQKVTYYGEGKGKNGKLGFGLYVVGETSIQTEMVRNGWAISHHSATEGWEMIARENKRGLWRGQFVMPERWRKGERLPGEKD